jgi:acetylornithine/succinyldiaminopimelate/putrescine aminotransferase/predicted amino acid dehydrogenase
MPDQQIYPVAVPALGRTMSDLYGRYCRKDIVDRLKAVCLDAVYTRAIGDKVWWQKNGEIVEVLDMAGGYGATLFGHNHPALAEEMIRLIKQNVPVLTQASVRAGAALLAQRLSQLVDGDYVTIFTNSGAETADAAMEHTYLAYYKQQRPANPVFWAVKEAFHGKTWGAIQLTPRYRGPFGQWGPPVRFLDPDDPADWENAWRVTGDRVVAAFVEPIQGEGGIRPMPEDFLMWLSEKRRAGNFPLVVDEIQTGMGRTGTFLASEQFGLEPDYICLSKALGGGFGKIGALLIKRNKFISEFGLKHTSTFAEDDLSCFVAFKALQILEEEQLATRCAEAGNYLLEKLEAVRASFPGQIREIRGRGLMIGIELTDQSNSASNIVKMVSDLGYLGWLAAAYLLNVHHIRIVPTLSNPFTLRVEPSAYISTDDLDRLVRAIHAFAEALELADASYLAGFLVDEPVVLKQKHFPIPKREQPSTPDIAKVAFLGHYGLDTNVATFDPSIAEIPPEKLGVLIEKTWPILKEPAIFDQINVRSEGGKEVHITFIGLSITAQQIRERMLAHDLKELRQQIDAAVALARDIGCSVVGLGAMTSSVTNNCKAIDCPKGIVLTSGNSLTVGMGVLATEEAARKYHIALTQACVGIVGVPGNIASTYAILMAPRVKRLILIPGLTRSSQLAVGTLLAQISAASPETEIEVSADLAALRSCSLIVTASTSGGGIIQPEHLGNKLVAICDISFPSDVHPSVRKKRPDVLIFQGGDVCLPYNPDFSLSGIDLPRGHTLACVAEAMLLGLEQRTTEHFSYGRVNPQRVAEAVKMAEDHGFTLGEFLYKE